MANYTQPMGIGVVGGADITFKRKFRFTFEIHGFCNNVKNLVPEYFVTVAGRPNLTIDETEINHLNAKTWIPGKASWNTITVTYLDVAHDEMRSLWNWLATIYDFTDPVNLHMGEKRDWDATGLLNMYDGCGTLIEGWEMQHLWPTTIDFGEVDYSTSDIATISLTLRFSDVKYKSYCPAFTPAGCCSPCGTSTTINSQEYLV